MSAAEQLEPSQLAASPVKVRGLTLRAVLIAALLTFLAAKWVQTSEVVVAGCLVSESVPPIPVVAALMLLAALIPVFSKILGRNALTRSEAMTIFATMAVGVTLMGYGGLSYFLGGLLPLFYFASPSNNYADFQKYVPSWFHPRNQEVINEFFEGSYTGVTPWAAWLPYLALWSGFFLVLFFTMMCLVRIFYDYWVRQERLTFPLVQMATALGYATSSHEGQPPFFRNPLVWCGLAIAVLFNGTNMLKAFNSDFPALGKWYDLSGIFRERPWSAVGGLYFRWDPSLAGMGYLMSAEVLLSVMVGHFFMRAQSVAAAAVGYEAPFPWREGASSGAYLVLAFFLVWGARRYLWQSLRRAFGASAVEEGVPLAPRWAFRGVVAGLALLAAFFLACKLSLQRQGADLSLWVIGGFLFLFFAFAVAYARIRAEAGAPMSWLYPYGAHQSLLFNSFGSKTLLHAGGPANFIILTEFWFLSRGFFQSEMGVQVENFRIGETTGIGTSPMARAGMIGLLIGLGFGIYVHLSAYYNYGLNILHVPSNDSMYREAIQRATNPAAADLNRAAWIASCFIGMAATVGLTFARKAFFRFPLHPLGLAMGIAYGDPLWGPFLLAWLCKVLAIKMGGMRLYRRFIPLFLGAVVGHYFAGGVVWGLLGITEHPAFFRYRVYFG